MDNLTSKSIGFSKVTFELQNDGGVKVFVVRTATKTFNGAKFLKYNQ